MRNAIRRKGKLGLSALAVAGLGAWAGVPAAHGDFIVTVDTPTTYTSDGINYSVYVFSAQNTGTNGTGSELLGLNGFINTPGAFNSTTGALGMDIEKVSGTGSKTVYQVNVDGTANSDNTYDSGGPAEFGDGAGGSFLGIGSGPYSTDLVNNGQTTEGGTQAVYVNAQTTDYTPFNDTQAVVKGTQANLDPQFTTPGFHPGTSAALGTIDNGTVHALQIEELANAGAGATVANFAGGVPFAQVVVPTGTQFTLHGQLLGEIGNNELFSTVVGGSVTVTGLTISLTGTAGPNQIGTITMAGSNGHYSPQTIAVPGGDQTTGNLTVAGFNPTSDTEIYGLDAVGATSLTTLIADLNTQLALNDPGATAEVPTGSAGTILTAAGDNVELVFPTGAPGAPTPVDLAFNFANYSTNGSVTITSITVIPEPTSIGALALGGFGLLSRKRRRRLA
jgi:hypothetical protein